MSISDISSSWQWGYISMRISDISSSWQWGYISMSISDISSSWQWGYISMSISDITSSWQWGYISMSISDITSSWQRGYISMSISDITSSWQWGYISISISDIWSVQSRQEMWTKWRTRIFCSLQDCREGKKKNMGWTVYICLFSHTDVYVLKHEEVCVRSGSESPVTIIVSLCFTWC